MASTVVTINSAYFRDVFLRLDANNLTRFQPSGGGHANCQFGMLSWEHFNMTIVNPGTPKVVTFESVQWPNRFLRMDGSGSAFPGGTVNGQFGHFAWEEFKVIHQTTPAGSVAF